jgi:nucleotide-binding universal stress UspA family protein
MAIKDILVHLDNSPQSDRRLDVAAMLARKHDAHLTGLAVIEVPSPEYFVGNYPGNFMAFSPEDLITQIRLNRMAEVDKIKQRFDHRVQLDALRAEWRVVEGDVAKTVALHGRYADLVIVGQHDRASTTYDGAFQPPVPALMMCGRPLLVVPFVGKFETLGSNILVAWNATPEAARAVNEALPFLQVARDVTVLSINPRSGINGDGDVPAADIAIHLARHGIKARAAHTVAKDVGEGDALLSYAADIGADMLVMGMYGHSRLHELVFGVVTRDLLSEMTMPTFMVP